MDIGSFIQTYFVNQMWDRTGYNIVNTSVYAALALGALCVLWWLFQKYKVRMDGPFWAAVACWSLWGSSIRVLTDSVDGGTMAKALAGASSGMVDQIARLFYPAILNTHILDYGVATVSPGIYLVTAALFLSAIVVSRKLGMPYWAAWAGGLGAAFNLFLLLPMMHNWAYAAVPVLLALGVGALCYYGLKWRQYQMWLPVMAQALDGASTWITINWFGPASGIGYFEQHVLSGAIGTATPLGFGLYFLVKVGFAALAVWVLKKEDLDENTRHLALLVIVVIGLAPGSRDLLRMLCGT